MTTRPQGKHGWPFWFAVGTISLPFLYVASFGPACWIGSRVSRGAEEISTAYQPLMQFMVYGPSPFSDAVYKYATFGVTEEWQIVHFMDEGSETIQWHQGMGMF